MQVPSLEEIKSKPYLLRNIGEMNQTEEMCLAAVKENGYLLMYVAKPFLTEKVCMAAVKQLPACFWMVPLRLQTPEICLEAVSRYPECIKYVRFQTPELCRLAISMDITSLRYVRKQRPEYCELAVRLDPHALLLCKHKTPKLMKMAVEKDSRLIQFIKKKYQKQSICLTAVKDNWENLHFVENQTEKVCEAALSQSLYAAAFLRNPSYAGRYLAKLLNKPQQYDDPLTKVFEFLCKRVDYITQVDLEAILRNARPITADDFLSSDGEDSE
jgi:hypothetical protein